MKLKTNFTITKIETTGQFCHNVYCNIKHDFFWSEKLRLCSLPWLPWLLFFTAMAWICRLSSILPFFLYSDSLACLIRCWALHLGYQFFPQLVWRADRRHPAECLPPHSEIFIFFLAPWSLPHCPLVLCYDFAPFFCFSSSRYILFLDLV